jgi:hypothetical protein
VALPFYESFTKDAVKTSPTIQRYKTAEDLAEAHLNLEKRFGIDPNRRLDLPEKADDKEGWKAVYEKLGVPKTPDDYGFKMPDAAPEADKALVGEYVKLAHEANVPKAQAEALFKWFTDKATAAAAAQAEAFAAQAKAGEAELKKEWGDAYDHRSKEIGRLLIKHGDAQLAKDLEGKLGNYPGLARTLGKIVDAMAEPSAAGGGSGEAGTGERPLTPAQSKAEARKIEAMPAFRDAKDPTHKDLVRRRSELLRAAEGGA